MPSALPHRSGALLQASASDGLHCSWGFGLEPLSQLLAFKNPAKLSKSLLATLPLPFGRLALPEAFGRHF